MLFCALNAVKGMFIKVKTSKNVVVNRFGRLLSGILSAAMVFSAAAFQTPVSASDENGGYEVLYDFVKDGYKENGNFSDNGTDTITENSNWSNIKIEQKGSIDPITSGTVRFHFEYRHGYTWRLPVWYIVAAEQGNNISTAGTRWIGLSEKMTEDDVFKIGYYGGKENWTFNETSTSTFAKDTWYDIDTIYNLDEGKAFYYIDGNKIAESTGPNKITSIGLSLTHNNTSAGIAEYKNMKLIDEKLTISGIKSVQYSNDGENYSPAIDKVDAETKYVKIDFASAMDASTLDNIKLSNGSAAVAATGAASSDNKTYTLTLNENLAVSTEYTLNIPQTVKTSDGAVLAREYNGKIMTTAGVFRVDLFDIQKNGATVQKSDIAKGDTVNAVVNITNTEGRVGTAYVCICVYNNNVMTGVNFLPIDLATESTKSVPLNINSVDGLKIKAFL